MAMWQHMGRKIDWMALPILSELLEVEDPELLITSLLFIQSREQR